MRSRCLLSVVFVLSSLIMSDAQVVILSGHFCHRSSGAGEGQTRLAFLREETNGLRSLYLTLWSEDIRLLRCEVSTDPLVTESYLSLCSRMGTQGQEITQRFNITMLLDQDGPCALHSIGAPQFTKRTKRDEGEGKTRRKRAWIFPGTLWCGTGSKAIGYEELGMFESADRCCREHDHCMHIIPAFTVNYGVLNPNFFSVSHCDCDQRFRECLLGVNDTISNMVGYSFFNILRVPCFELIQQRRCTKMYWWGMCKVAEKAPYAVFQKPFSYKATPTASKYGDKGDGNESSNIKEHHVKERPPTISNRKSPKANHRCKPRDPPRGDTFHRKKRKGKGCNRRRKTTTTTTPSISVTHTTISPTLTTALPTQTMTSLTSELKTAVSKASKINKSIINQMELGKKKGTREHVTHFPVHRRQDPSQVTTKPYQRTSTTTMQRTPPVTQRAGRHLSTTIATVSTITTTTQKKVQKKHRRCGPRIPVRGDTFEPRCKACLEQKTSPSTTTAVSPSQVTTAQTQGPNKTPASPKIKTSARPWKTATTTVPMQVKSKTGLVTQTAAPRHQNSKSPKQRNIYALWDKTSQEPMITDNPLLCESFKHLDQCQYKIPPVEKKYGLQNVESKTVYHCDCTSRLAGQIEHFKAPSILPSLLTDFVSQYCFKLPQEKKCHNRKSCAAGFSKASDLLQALKKIDEKATAGVQNSGKAGKRGAPVRLYKRCLRIVDPGRRG